MTRFCRWLGCAVGASAIALALPASGQQAPSQPSARDRLIDHLTRLADAQTSARAAQIAAITTPAQARERQVAVRAALADLIRPEHAAGTVRSAVTHTGKGEGYTIEALWYESLPDYRVTADLYRPNGAGPFPAIIVQPGHGVDGKLGDHAIAAQLARAGFVVLSIDIVGEGERLQFHDPEVGASKVGRPTGEHSMAFAQALPAGGHVSRFFLQDAIRGVDYLMSRADVDGGRIGAFGCSGGGTAAAYLAAFDSRIAATAIGCFTNTYDHLLAPGGPGPQDAEQSIPFFLERGLDLPDWIEAVAPRPYAVVSTTSDMFPIAGAREAYAEASRFYGVLGAGDRLTMIEGPGGHGALAPIMPKIVAFFTRWLKNDTTERPFVPEPVGDPARLLVFPDAAPGSTPGGRSLARVIAAVANAVRPAAGGNVGELRQAVRERARISVAPSSEAPEMTLGAAAPREGYTLQPLGFAAAADLRVDGLYARAVGKGSHPTLLLLASNGLQGAANAGGLLDRWAKAGWNVLALEPRGAGGSEELKSALTGDWTLLSLRALLVGKTPLGMRADDALAALNWLARRPEVDRRHLAVHGAGALGPVALHVGVLDARVTQVFSDGAITSFREIAERPISRNAAEVSVPDVLSRYDLPDLMSVLGTRLTLINPVNAVGEPLRLEQRTALPQSVRVITRSARDPIAPPSFSRR
ncbi:acetylxylan esterase [Sphingomonas sp. S2-65]|uniref:alpha/beta hydrolase n=1 Tax=Sphingomonas sp. S2-65 TaxID=2903960 RepID=UPI001F233479|nr:acetylxylan esterase [Sphingomonas sp. S2-65]UYY58151.1 acetylxylan esterase [Sphingomonas sp. S2-65]